MKQLERLEDALPYNMELVSSGGRRIVKQYIFDMLGSLVMEEKEWKDFDFGEFRKAGTTNITNGYNQAVQSQNKKIAEIRKLLD